MNQLADSEVAAADLSLVDVGDLWNEIRLRMLRTMRQKGAGQDYCLTHAGIGWTKDHGVPREAVSAILKDLKRDDLVGFIKGLWSESGEMAGAGHYLTKSGIAEADAGASSHG